MTLVLGGGLAATLSPGTFSGAEQAYGRIAVSVTVEPHAALAIHSQPAALTLGAIDIERGYVDVATPTEIEVQSNSREGYVLSIVSGLPGVTGLEILGLGSPLGSPVTLAGAGGSIIERWSSDTRRAAVTLRFRLALSPALTPGTYPWPLRLSATAL